MKESVMSKSSMENQVLLELLMGKSKAVKPLGSLLGNLQEDTLMNHTHIMNS